jgi:hypothetical protein
VTFPAVTPGVGEVLPDPSGSGTVAVDVGAGAAALVLWAPAELDGEEIEIRPVGEPWRGRHVAVRPRVLPGGRRWAAVFAPLAVGRHELRVRPRTDDSSARPDGAIGAAHGDRWGPSSRSTLTVTVPTGGVVVEHTWPSEPPSP